MIERLDTLPYDVRNIILYTNSPELHSIVVDKIKQRFKIDRTLCNVVNNKGDFSEVRQSTFGAPFGGGLWFIDVDVDGLKLTDDANRKQVDTMGFRTVTVGEVAKAINGTNNAAITLYWTSKYSSFKKILDLDAVKRQGVYCTSLYLGRVESSDIDYLYKYMVSEEDNKLDSKLLKYVKKNYTFNVDKICNLFKAVSNGKKFTTQSEIEKYIGIGGNSIDLLAFKLLTVNPKTEAGVKSAIKTLLNITNDLVTYSEYDYQKVYNYLNTIINSVKDVKLLQAMGRFSTVRMDVPEVGYDQTKIEMLKKHYHTILEEVSMPRVLMLKSLLEEYVSFNYQMSLTEVFIAFVAQIYNNNTKNENSKEKFSTGKRAKNWF